MIRAKKIKLVNCYENKWLHQSPFGFIVVTKNGDSFEILGLGVITKADTLEAADRICHNVYQTMALALVEPDWQPITNPALIHTEYLVLLPNGEVCEATLNEHGVWTDRSYSSIQPVFFMEIEKPKQ